MGLAAASPSKAAEPEPARKPEPETRKSEIFTGNDAPAPPLKRRRSAGNGGRKSAGTKPGNEESAQILPFRKRPSKEEISALLEAGKTKQEMRRPFPLFGAPDQEHLERKFRLASPSGCRMISALGKAVKADCPAISDWKSSCACFRSVFAGHPMLTTRPTRSYYVLMPTPAAVTPPTYENIALYRASALAYREAWRTELSRHGGNHKLANRTSPWMPPRSRFRNSRPRCHSTRPEPSRRRPSHGWAKRITFGYGIGEAGARLPPKIRAISTPTA